MRPIDTEPDAGSGRLDAATFGSLIRRYDRDLRGVAWSVVRSAHATDDVMQTAYEKAFRSLDAFDAHSSIKTWLHSIVYRAAIDHVRYEGRRHHDELTVVDNVNPGGDATSVRAIGGAEFAAAMDALDPKQRAALMLTSALGYSFDEAARITGTSRGTVASRASRARAKLARWEAT